MKLLFVCMGNICRSPSGENVIRHLLERERATSEMELDSAGTIGMHAGNPPDSRMTKAAQARGIEMHGRARQVRPQDLDDFDLILAMDRANFVDLENLASNGDQVKKIRLFCDFCTEHTHKEVPDPYYGGEAGFELVLDLLEDGCEEIFRQFKAGKLGC
tara:strand:+ start:8259 stop:8735 length:477 start_codon:yes stop_codon:yes gene_type:complete